MPSCIYGPAVKLEVRNEMNRVVHFEIPADDPEKAVAFYERAFGWKVEKWDGAQEYWMVNTGEQGVPGIGGAIMRKYDNRGTVNTIDVDSVDAAVKKIEAAGGKVTAPKMAVPGIGYMAYCTDTEGNVFGIMQMDETVK